MSAPPSSSTYTYRPVDAAHQGFRIAILQPSPEFQAPIRCSLIEVSVSNKVEYEAISYVWGDPSNQACVEVEGETLMVTANLVLALRHIRHQTNARYVWADAICIDQKNLEERAQQVQLMKDIYTLCTRDLIWVGESEEDTEKAIETLRRMEQLGLRRQVGAQSFGEKGPLEDLGFGLDESMSLYCLLEEPTIWRRVWVMQEICCCPEATILIGNYSLPWSVLSNILDHSGIPDRFHKPFGHGTLMDFWGTFSGVQVIEHQRDSAKGLNTINSTLIDVLSRFREAHSTDPRDKIYGLLGLASDDHGIVPNYRASVREIYIRIVKAQILKEQNLDMVTQSLWPLGAGTEESDDVLSSTADLPSWLPNFSSAESKTLLFAQRGIFATGPAAFIKPVDISPTGELRIHGAFLGTIKTLKKVDYQKPELRAIMGGAAPLVAQHYLPDALMTPIGEAVEYPTGGDAFEAYWRTLLADCAVYPARRLSVDDIEKYGKIFNRWRQVISLNVELPRKVWDEDELTDDRQKKAFRSRTELQKLISLTDKIYNWQFAELENGLYSLVPVNKSSRTTDRAAEEGDSIVLVDGGKVPLAVRRVSKEEGEKWELLGTAYVHGYMDDAWKLVDGGRLKWVPITLV